MTIVSRRLTGRMLGGSIIVFFLGLAGVAEPGQGTRSTISGTVRNPEGAPQPTVTVNVVNLETDDERQAITDEQGAYVVGGLLPGRYRVKIDEGGTAPFESREIRLSAGDRRTIDVRLAALAVASRSDDRSAPKPVRPPSPPFTSCNEPLPSGTTPTPSDPIPDYVPCPDRWRLDFPVWQRYPASQPVAR